MRYALYFAAPADDPLMRLGNRWLGRDPFSGALPDQPAVAGLAGDRFAELTAEPRRYGFHGTLKAPFSLREGVSEADLLDACAAFAGEVSPFDIAGLGVNRLGRFLALTPCAAETELTAFAALCVRVFEPFRAPLSEADVARRRKSGLSPKLDAYMTAWGYPYIFDEFRFHMTLTGKLDDDTEAVRLQDAATAFFKDVTGTPRTCRHLGLYVEPERGAPFLAHRLFELTGRTPVRDMLAREEATTRKDLK